jgi:hypothetical protein
MAGSIGRIKKSGLIPLQKIIEIRILKSSLSFQTRSTLYFLDRAFGSPKKIRLNLQSVYIAPRTLLNEARISDCRLVVKIPTKIRNSPTKPAVRGNPIFARQNIRKI